MSISGTEHCSISYPTINSQRVFQYLDGTVSSTCFFQSPMKCCAWTAGTCLTTISLHSVEQTRISDTNKENHSRGVSPVFFSLAFHTWQVIRSRIFPFFQGFLLTQQRQIEMTLSWSQYDTVRAVIDPHPLRRGGGHDGSSDSQELLTSSGDADLSHHVTDYVTVTLQLSANIFSFLSFSSIVLCISFFFPSR